MSGAVRVVGHAPGWVALAALVLGAGVGLLLARRLAAGGYRSAEELDRAAPGPRWWLVAVSALLWGSLAWRFGTQDLWPYLGAALYFAVAGVALTAIDLDVHRLPERITLPSYGVLLLLLVLASALTGEWGAVIRAVVAAGVSWVCYFALAYAATFVSPGGLGLGDVTLSGLLGLLVGWVGWESVVVAPFATFLIAGMSALTLLLLRRADRHTHIAFGPYMVAGAWVALMLSPARLLTAGGAG